MLNGLTKEFYEVAKNDGFNQGKEQGIEQGLEQGLEKGLSQGLDVSRKLIMELLNQNIITEEIVMEKLNITKEELEELKKKYK